VTAPDDPARFDADVVVVGFGPTGATLAGLAARRGLRVVVLDRDIELYPLPRAVQCDHEVLRILQELGCADEILATTVLNDGLDLVAADRSVLQSFSVPAMAPTGWPTSVFFHQPTFETVLRRTVADLGAEVRLGHGVTALTQDDSGVTATVADGTTVRARYAVGCDGARSATRKVIGTALRDTGFEESWLVVDLVRHERSDHLPTRCLQVCDPARPHTLVPMPWPRFRFEFMLLPGEEPQDLMRPEVIEHLLRSWTDPAQAEIERAAVYTFHGLVASRWRNRRVLLAGDAAHQTPPFLGQGMCAGMRDAANLVWKLAAVIDDGSHQDLLDTYQQEREPHAQAVIDLAVGFGQLICMTDPEAAAARDTSFRAAPPSRAGRDDAPNLIPPLRAGPGIGPGGGDLSRQPRLGGVRLDDLIGSGFALCTADPLDPASPEAAWWAARGAVLDTRAHPELQPLLAGERACVIRPDRYVLGRGTVADLTDRTSAFLGGELSPLPAW
jgi:3-(3-hydroxy-phenyl)propionate hydroxylase